MKPTICIDFDGTICDHEFPDCGAPKPGVKEAIDKLKERFEIVISSCRTAKMFRDHPLGNQYIGEMVGFLRGHNIHFDRIDMGDEGKVVATYYIDDRAIRFTNWSDVLKQLEGLES